MLTVCVGDSAATSSSDASLFNTVEEVAAQLSIQEGRRVTCDEVRQIEARALRKLRAEFARRGLGVGDLAPR